MHGFAPRVVLMRKIMLMLPWMRKGSKDREALPIQIDRSIAEAFLLATISAPRQQLLDAPVAKPRVCRL